MGVGAKLVILALVLGAVGTSSAGIWYWYTGSRGERTDILTARVRKDKLAITVKERGILESAENNDVTCRVKARTQNATVATTIKWVIDDGSHVKKGDLLVDLDDSGLVETLKTQNITVDKARADWISAQEQYKITVSQNESDIATAQVNLKLAQLDLKKYVEGDYEQNKKTILGNIQTAESDLEQYRDRSAWSDRMVKKGYQTQAQADADRAKLKAGEIALARAKEDLRVLENYTKEHEVTKFENAVKEAERALERVKTQAKAKEVTSRTDRDAKKSVLDQESGKQKDLEDEIKKCRIFAPQDGLVVYYIPEQARWGSGSQQSTVAQGEPVREGQKLMRIPDLKRMMVNTKVHEALVSNVKGELRDESGKVVYRGQDARVRVDAYNDQDLKAHVKSVATVAAQSDWMSADVKMYVTMIALDEVLENLKPGMSAEVSILVDKTANDVHIIPVQAIMGSPAMGKKRYCWVKTETGYEEREIEVGASNEKEAEIRSGLKEGELVVLNYKVLEDDRKQAKKPSLAEQRGNDEVKPTDWGNAPSPSAELENASKALNQAGGPGGQKGGFKKDGKGGGMKKGGPGGFQMDPEMQKKAQEFNDRFMKATPAQRKEMLEQIPESFREQAKQRFKSQGLEIAD
jgi:multidrug resistance efflux pump